MTRALLPTGSGPMIFTLLGTLFARCRKFLLRVFWIGKIIPLSFCVFRQRPFASFTHGRCFVDTNSTHPCCFRNRGAWCPHYRRWQRTSLLSTACPPSGQTLGSTIVTVQMPTYPPVPSSAVGTPRLLGPSCGAPVVGDLLPSFCIAFVRWNAGTSGGCTALDLSQEKPTWSTLRELPVLPGVPFWEVEFPLWWSLT